MMNPIDDWEEVDAESSGGERQKHGVAKIASINVKVDEVQSQVHKNITTALANIEKAEDLEAASTELVKNAKAFKKTSRKTRREMMIQNWKWSVVLLLVVCALAAAGFGIFHQSSN
mmetsp:Transcript_8349/g.17499  ORF Transcript_8349/g.17499 Transcript_8349/m.17499 type:complete len:116 (+) Transcript_8349:80-427(+)